jgi:pentatricopeptide repeat protein
MLWSVLRAAEHRILSPDNIAALATTVSNSIPRHVAHRQLRRVLEPLKLENSDLNPSSTQKLAEIFADSSFPEGAEHVLDLAHSSGVTLNEKIYERVVQSLVHRKSWRTVPRVLSLAQRHNLRTTARLLNWRLQSAIQMQHFSLLDKILGDFEAAGVLPDRDTYHLLIRGHILNSNSQQAKDSLEWMVNSGFPITPETHVAILSAHHRTLGADLDVEAAAQDTIQQLDSGARPAANLLNHLMQSRIVAGDTAGAFNYLQMFDFSSCPGALDILREAFGVDAQKQPATKQHHPNDETLYIVVKFLSERVDMSRLQSVVQVFIKTGVPLSAHVTSELIRAMGRARYLHDAAGILAAACGENVMALHHLERVMHSRILLATNMRRDLRNLHPRAVIFNSFLAALLRVRGLSDVPAFFLCMSAAGLVPDKGTIHFLALHLTKQKSARPRDLSWLLRSLTENLQVDPNLSHFHAVFRAAIEQQRRLLKRPNKPLAVETLLIPSITRESGQIGAPSIPTNLSSVPQAVREHILPLLQSLSSSGAMTSERTLMLSMRYNAVIRSDMHAAERVLQVMRDRNIKPRISHYITLVEGYVLLGDMRRAASVFDQVKACGLTPNAVFYTVLITGYGRMRQPRAARAMFDAMVKASIEPDLAAIDATAWAMYIGGDPNAAKRFILEHWPTQLPKHALIEEENPRDVFKHFRLLRAEAEGQTVTHTGHRQHLLRIEMRNVRASWRKAFRHFRSPEYNTKKAL